MARRRISGSRVAERWTAIAATVVLLGRAAYALPPMLSSSGQADFVYGSTVEVAGGPATGYKPESKLFYTADLRWWAVFGTAVEGAQGVYLHRLDGNHRWQRVLKLPNSDPWAKADALLDGDTLYVALRDNRSTSSNARRSELHRVSYLGGGEWAKPATPTLITTGNPETLTLARDSVGRLWTAYESSLKIRVGHTAPGGTSFTFASLPTSAVDADDIAAIVSFGSGENGRIGVLWSNQVAQRDFFAWRYDGDAVTDASWHVETAYGGGVGGCSSRCADDHVNVKVFGDQVYAAVKTSLNDVSSPNPSAPLIVLLRRSGGGTWSAYRVSPASDNATRPIVVLAPKLGHLWVFAMRGSGVYFWDSPFDSPAFTTSPRVWTKSGSTTLANPTSTKQPTSGASGTVVETSSSGKRQYWQNEFLPQ